VREITQGRKEEGYLEEFIDVISVVVVGELGV
jgi:hypothetical protein